MRWLELSVEADVEAIEAVSEIFGRIGAGTAVQPTRLIRDPDDELAAREDPTAPYVITAHLAEPPDAAGQVDATERALWHLQAFGLRPVGELQVRSVDDADWTDAWKAGYVPQRIGRVVIVPSWLDEPIGPDEVALRLDPGMAFGTGLHPTTRGCLTLLQAVEPMPDPVLDVGCGSGILALAALPMPERSIAPASTPICCRERGDVGDRRAKRAGKPQGGSPEKAGVAEKRFELVVGESRGERCSVELAQAHLADHIAGARAPRCLPAGSVNQPCRNRGDRGFGGEQGSRLRERIDEDEWVTLRLRHAGVTVHGSLS